MDVVHFQCALKFLREQLFFWMIEEVTSVSLHAWQHLRQRPRPICISGHLWADSFQFTKQVSLLSLIAVYAMFFWWEWNKAPPGWASTTMTRMPAVLRPIHFFSCRARFFLIFTYVYILFDLFLLLNSLCAIYTMFLCSFSIVLSPSPCIFVLSSCHLSIFPFCPSFYSLRTVHLCICPFLSIYAFASPFVCVLSSFCVIFVFFFFISFTHYHALASSVWALFVRGLRSLLDRGIVTLFLLHLYCFLLENLFQSSHRYRVYLQQRTVERGKFGVAEGGQRKEGRKVGKEASSIIVVKIAVILIINIK